MIWYILFLHFYLQHAVFKRSLKNNCWYLCYIPVHVLLRDVSAEFPIFLLATHWLTVIGHHVQHWQRDQGDSRSSVNEVTAECGGRAFTFKLYGAARDLISVSLELGLAFGWRKQEDDGTAVAPPALKTLPPTTEDFIANAKRGHLQTIINDQILEDGARLLKIFQKCVWVALGWVHQDVHFKDTSIILCRHQMTSSKCSCCSRESEGACTAAQRSCEVVDSLWRWLKPYFSFLDVYFFHEVGPSLL